MGIPESRWARVPLHPVVLASVALLAASCRSASLPPKEPPKTLPEQTMPAWEHELRAKLRKPVAVEFRAATLAEACETLSKLAGVPIRIDPAVGAKSTPITLPKVEMSAEHVLRWICRIFEEE